MLLAKQLYYKTGSLAWFILRRDRIRIPIWVISLMIFTLVVAVAYPDLYPTEQDRQMIAETMRNPAMTAMFGPGYWSDNFTIGAMFAHEMLLFTALAVGIMGILFVARHTRADEEDGRIEMIRSLPSGRLSNLNATMLVSVFMNVLLTLVVGLGLYVLGIDSIDLKGSILYGAALGATGLVFAAITALFAQLTESSRGTIGFSIGILLLAYLVRAIGDVNDGVLSWFSPLGWILKAEVFVNNSWWPIVLTVGVSLVLFLLSLYLNAIRDMGSGFIHARGGRSEATRFLQSPFGLALRLQRVGIISWAVGMFVLGASYGSILGDLESFFANNDALKEMLSPVAGYSLTEQFIAMLMMIISIISTIPPLMAILKLRGEEKKNRVEHMLSRAVSRNRLLGSYLVISLLVGFVMLSLAAVGIGSIGIAVMDSEITFATFYRAAIVYLPAMWVMIGLAVLMIGLFPRFTGFTWLFLTFSFFVVYLGKLLKLPDWLNDLSPFSHVSQVPIEEFDFGKATVLTLIALSLMVTGFIGYKKRDK